MKKLAEFIGDIARPVSIMVTSLAGAIASVITALRVENGNDGALLIGAIFVGVSALYGFKAVEVWKNHKADSDVKIEEAKTNGNESGS